MHTQISGLCYDFSLTFYGGMCVELGARLLTSWHMCARGNAVLCWYVFVCAMLVSRVQPARMCVQ